MGVCHTPSCAKAFIVKDCLDELRYYDVYNPSMRYYYEEDQAFNRTLVRWQDHWLVQGVPLYRVEVFCRDEKQESFHFNFDARLKQYIVKNRLSSAKVKEVKELLLDWKKNASPVQPDSLLMSWFDSTEITYWDTSTHDSIQTWVSLHGSIKPYPWNLTMETRDDLL